MKTGNENYIQVSRLPFDKEHAGISLEALGLFYYLNELEQRYCGKKNPDTFTHTDKQISEELDISLKTLKKYKAELKAKAGDLIDISTVHYELADGSKSIQQCTAYRIKK